MTNYNPPWKEKYMGKWTLHKDLANYTSLTSDEGGRPIPLSDWIEIMVANTKFLVIPNEYSYIHTDNNSALKMVTEEFTCDLCGTTIKANHGPLASFNEEDEKRLAKNKQEFQHVNYRHLNPFLAYKFANMKITDPDNYEKRITLDVERAGRINKAKSAYDLNIALWMIVVEENWENEFRLYCLAKVLDDGK